MAHKIWSDEEECWVPASDERVAELQTKMVKAGDTVPLPPVHPSGDQGQELPLPQGVDEGDILWMIFNEQLNLDRAR